MRCRISMLWCFGFSVLIFFSSLVTFSSAGTLIYSTYLGGGDNDESHGIALDNSENAYITGETDSIDFPTIPNAFDISANGSRDVFVTKLNTTGTALVYSTYIGGGNYDIGHAITVDNSGNAYIIGYTDSSDFPTTPGAYSGTYNGDTDGFIIKINATGTALVYSTYIGGGSVDIPYGITIDNLGNTYITGFTNSADYPITPSAYSTTYHGYRDVFVTKLNTQGTALLYSTYLGGGDPEMAYGIVIDSSDNAYITGLTLSSDFPTSSGAFDTTFNGLEDVFVTKLDATGTALLYSTYLGGKRHDGGIGIAIDSSENVYITGRTRSTDFPTTPGAFDTLYNGLYDAFISKLNAAGTALIYSSYVGGGNNDFGNGITIDSIGNAYVTGRTNSTDFPTTADAYDKTFNGDTDVFVSKLNATGTVLNYSTYLGGGSYDEGNAIAINGSGVVYLSGYTHSTDFPSTAGAFSPLLNGGEDAFVIKMSLGDINPYLNSYGEFTIGSDTLYWYFEKYGDGISAGTLSWVSSYQCVNLSQTPGQKGKLTQVFSVPSTGWYTAVARVLTDITNMSKQQKVYIYLQELDSSDAIVAAGNQVVQSGSGGLSGRWKQLQISFYAQKTVLGVQVVAINPTNSNATGSLYLDDIWVYAATPQGTTPILLTNPSFDTGTVGWMYAIYADGTGPGIWSEWSGFLIGSQAGGEKGRVSQIYSSSTSNSLGSVWIYSGATAANNTQKIYLYIYSYDSEYTTIIGSGNAILQPGKWIPGEWRQLQFEYTPFTVYNAVQLVSINPIGNPYQAIYFDEVVIKQ
ncbi:MAG: SBBP repeat-containing protein [bacterium]